MKRICLTLILISAATLIFAQNTPPKVMIQQVTVDQTLKQIAITYDLVDAENDPCEVWVKATGQWSTYFEVVDQTDLTGDAGTGILPGTGHTVVWSYDSLPVSVFSTRVGVYASDGQAVAIQPMVDLVDSAKLLENLLWIEGVRHYQAAPGHLSDVRDSLENIFIRHGLQTERQPFPFSNTQGFNIVGRKPGMKDEEITYIVCGHYDGVPGSPAADDNGSAVTGVLEILRILSQYQFEHSIRFIGFDLEEHGLVGSTKYVQHEIKPYENLQGVLNFEMIGYYDDAPNTQSLPSGFNVLFPQQTLAIQADSSRGNFLIVVGNTVSNPLITAFMNAATQYVPNLKTISLEVPGVGQLAPDLRRSDHAPFWDAGKKALMLTDGAETRNYNYHSPGDSVGTLNMTFLTRNIKATLATLATLAVPVSAGYDTFDLAVLSNPDHLPSEQGLLELFPNPAKDHVTIRYACPGHQPSHLEITDGEGRILQKHLLPCRDQHGEFRADLTGMAPGMYIVSLRSDDQVLSHKVLRI